MFDDEVAQVNWHKMNGIIPAIIQHADTGKILMLGYMNEEALKASIGTGQVIFYSRSKKRLWQKGEQSGNTLTIVKINVDCDQDALLILVLPVGATCHCNTESCFTNATSRLDLVIQIERIIAARKAEPKLDSYVSQLLHEDLAHIAQKVGEEAVETVLAAVAQSDEKFLAEAADLFFHFEVLLSAKGYSLLDVLTVLQSRMK